MCSDRPSDPFIYAVQSRAHLRMNRFCYFFVTWASESAEMLLGVNYNYAVWIVSHAKLGQAYNTPLQYPWTI